MTLADPRGVQPCHNMDVHKVCTTRKHSQNLGKEKKNREAIKKKTELSDKKNKGKTPQF